MLLIFLFQQGGAALAQCKDATRFWIIVSQDHKQKSIAGPILFGENQLTDPPTTPKFPGV